MRMLCISGNDENENNETDAVITLTYHFSYSLLQPGRQTGIVFSFAVMISR